MATALTVNADTKRLTTTARWVYRATEAVTATNHDGSVFPVGVYTLAVTVARSTLVTQALTRSGDGLTLTGDVDLDVAALGLAIALGLRGFAAGQVAIANATTGARYILDALPIFDDLWTGASATPV